MYDLDGPIPDPEPTPPFCALVDEGAHYECRLCTCGPGDQFSCIEFRRVVPAPDATPRRLADPKLDCAERRRRMSESSMTARINSKQQMNWLVDATRVAKLVARKRAASDPSAIGPRASPRVPAQARPARAA